MGDCRAPYETVILSPHSDDAAFMAGGMILNYAKLGHVKVHVININTISDFAPSGETHDKDEMTEQRKKEDKEFAGLTGCIMHDVGMLDAPLRGYGGCNFSGDVGNDVIPYVVCKDIGRELGTVKELKDRLSGIFAAEIGKDPAVYAPWGIGGHVDHVVAHMAALQLMEEGLFKKLRFCEDQPYVASESMCQITPTYVMQRHRIKPVIIDFDIEVKVRLMEVYQSQLKNEWMAEIIRYAAELNKETGGNGHSERVWVVH